MSVRDLYHLYQSWGCTLYYDKWRYLIALFIASIINFTYAVTGYQVELLIFSQINGDATLSEKWDTIDKQSFNDNQFVNLFENKSPDIKKISDNNYILNHELLRLKKSQQYKILLHLAWYESLMQAAKKTKIHLYGGRLYNESGEIIQTITNESIPYKNNQNWELDGVFTVQLDHYFITNFNLQLALPMDNFNKLANQVIIDPQEFKYFNINHNRRTRSGEVNYVDHPLYGILFKVTPVNCKSLNKSSPHLAL